MLLALFCIFLWFILLTIIIGVDQYQQNHRQKGQWTKGYRDAKAQMEQEWYSQDDRGD